MAFLDEKKRPAPLVMERKSSTDSDSSSESSLKGPRTPRFAEATTVHSPVEPSKDGRSPFADPPQPKTQFAMPQSQPSDIGFGYISDNRHSHVEIPITPASPLKSAMKVPGSAPRKIDNPLSPTFREEQVMEKHETMTEKEQAKDLVVKTRVRIAKLCLRWVNFSCSLIVLAMLSTSLHIFFATKHLAPKNNLPPWATGTQLWPQYVVLTIASISLAFCLLIFYSYWRGGHRRAEKTAVYYTIFACGFFIFSIIMWAVAAGALQGSKNGSGNKDLWGWSCVDNTRSELFKDDVDYELVCRLQSWSLICCIIEVVVEIFTIAIYGIVFYRYYSKRKLRKSMDMRDKARSDLYLAQLRVQSAPNTPGFGPMSPSFSMHAKSPRFPPTAHDQDPLSRAEDGISSVEPGTRFVEAKPTSTLQTRPFTLQPPPIKVHGASPKVAQTGFELPAPAPYSPPAESRVEPAPVAPGEKQYASVPIPGAYQPASPPPQKSAFNFATLPGQAVTSEHRIESPPASPRLGRASLR